MGTVLGFLDTFKAYFEHCMHRQVDTYMIYMVSDLIKFTYYQCTSIDYSVHYE